MESNQEQKAVIKVGVLNEVLKYLAARPYSEVAGLVNAVQTAQIIPNEPEAVTPVADAKAPLRKED
tara:strand:+ start:3833 stop:4030 length:198 start_codon:yes stop_codon:yes gene_type:complete